jgi:hypothetical protein
METGRKMLLAAVVAGRCCCMVLTKHTKHMLVVDDWLDGGSGTMNCSE